MFGDKFFDITKESAVLDLTKYEIGYAVLKEVKIKGIDWKRVTDAWQNLLRFFSTIAVDDISEVQRIAIEKDLTFYDASYIYVAEKQNLKLVTEDSAILKASKNAVNLQEIKRFKRR